MDCKNCNNNYLYRIFRNCQKLYGSGIESIKKFDEICCQHGDYRDPVKLLYAIKSGNCDECNKYKDLYADIE